MPKELLSDFEFEVVNQRSDCQTIRVQVSNMAAVINYSESEFECDGSIFERLWLNRHLIEN